MAILLFLLLYRLHAENTSVDLTNGGERAIEKGYTTYTCDCGEFYKEYALPLNHDKIHHDGQAATCVEKGWKEYDTCSRCDYTTYEVIKPLGHDKVQHEAKAETCTEIGWESYETCSRCDYTTYVEIADLGHDITHYEGKAATCTEDGFEPYEACSRCDYTTFEVVPAIGHWLQAWFRLCKLSPNQHFLLQRYIY